MQTTVAHLLRFTQVAVAIGLSFVAMTIAARNCIVSAAAFDVQHKIYGDSLPIQNIDPAHAAQAIDCLSGHKRA